MAIGSWRCAPPLRIAGLSLLLAALPARAQDERPTGYPRSANERGGAPVDFSAVYTSEVRANLAGGVARGARYLDNLDLQLAIDADRLIGWRGARAFLYVIRNNGTSLSRLVGDVQTVSNIETGIRATRLFEAWLEQDVGPRASLKAGLYNLNSEFDTTDSGGLFVISSHGIGPDFSQSGRNGPSIFPVTSLALRAEYAPDDRWLVRAAVLDGVPGDPDHPARTAVKLGHGDGALLVAEADHLTRRAKLAVGVWRYTARFDRIGDPGGARARGNGGVYAFGETQLTGTAERGGAGLAGWVRAGAADRRFNPIAFYLGGGLVQTGLGKRADDQVGLSVAAVRFGRDARRVDDLKRREVVVEGAYRLVAASWLSLQPGVQWVIDPGGSRGLRDALVVGLRVKVGR